MTVRETASMGDLRKLLAHVDGDRTVELLVRAVEQYSPSYAEEPAMRVFAGRLQEAGVPFERQPVPGPSHDTERGNLIVRLGPEPVGLMLVGHVDTVTQVGDEEEGVHREGDRLYGLGTADMKSGCAAMVEAVIALAHSGVPLRRGVCLALVVGEEEYGDGAEVLLEETGAPLAVIGEPTGLVPCVRHYGYYECRLKTRGARAHAAFPEQGANAVHAMLVWLISILEEGQTLPFADRVAFNPREIRGGVGLFAVAEHCEAELDVHLPPGVGPEPVQAIIESARDRALDGHPRCRLKYEDVFWGEGYDRGGESEQLSPLQRAFEYLGLPWVPSDFRSHSDGSLFHQKGIVPVICGPGRLEVAHHRNEHVSLREACRAASLYAAMAYHACAATGGD